VPHLSEHHMPAYTVYRLLFLQPTYCIGLSFITVSSLINLPSVQFNPSPIYPRSHRHVKLPNVFVHVAWLSQTPQSVSVHSSRSIHAWSPTTQLTYGKKYNRNFNRLNLKTKTRFVY